jgi:isopropylmalate/homocitrate/citramalate synthase
MGANAFTHCAGVHTQAAARNPQHYQSLPPEVVGRRSQIALDHMAGESSVRACLKEIGENVQDALVRAVLRKVKEIGQTGRTVDLPELSMIVRSLHQREAPVRHEARPAQDTRSRALEPVA